MFICVCIYVNVHICIYIHTHTPPLSLSIIHTHESIHTTDKHTHMIRVHTSALVSKETYTSVKRDLH